MTRDVRTACLNPNLLPDGSRASVDVAGSKDVEALRVFFEGLSPEDCRRTPWVAWRSSSVRFLMIHTLNNDV